MNDRAYEIYKFACEYAKAAKLLNQQDLLLPSHSVAALALELYFKSLYYIEYGRDFKVNGKHSHDFYVLFQELSNRVKQDMVSDFNKILKNRDMSDVKILKSQYNFKISLDMMENLKIWSSVFVELRYFYDFKNKNKSMMFFPEIEKTILNALFQHKTEWKAHGI